MCIASNLLVRKRTRKQCPASLQHPQFHMPTRRSRQRRHIAARLVSLKRDNTGSCNGGQQAQKSACSILKLDKNARKSEGDRQVQRMLEEPSLRSTTLGALTQ